MLHDFTRLDCQLECKGIIVFHIVQKVVAYIHMESKPLNRNTEVNCQTIDQLRIIRKINIGILPDSIQNCLNFLLKFILLIFIRKVCGKKLLTGYQMLRQIVHLIGDINVQFMINNSQNLLCRRKLHMTFQLTDFRFFIIHTPFMKGAL